MAILQEPASSYSKDAYYFSHDSNARNDPKCLRLRRVLGMEGYGIFWVLVEMLREAKEYKLPLASVPDISFETRLPEEKILAVINNFELFEVEDGKFFSLRLLRSMEALENRRIMLSEAGKRGVQARLNQGLSIKVKESKEEESKVKKTIEERRQFFYQKIATFINTYSKEMLREFFDYWSEISEGQKKMRFEKQATFELSKRLARWKHNDDIKKNDYQKSKPEPEKIVAKSPFKNQNL